jgi:hypothetical protein
MGDGEGTGDGSGHGPRLGPGWNGGTGGRAFKPGIQDMAVQTSLWAKNMKPSILASVTRLHAGDRVESSDSRHVSKFN